MKIYNSLTKKIEEFKPIGEKKVGMYTCGPTVYDRVHVGNLRSFVFYDILYRILKYSDFKVLSIENITDIDDKIIQRAKEKGIGTKELADEYTKLFLEDSSKLNILPADIYPKATEHIGGMIKYIGELLKRGFAYVGEDGSVYFDISQFKTYGNLSGIKKEELKTGTRVLSERKRSLSDEYTKDDVVDFALWKSAVPSERGWDSPWGKGRPGWHIECSVMSQKYLGDTFDIHLGGVDLIFPHHENEVAQSEAKTGKEFVKFFVHGEHMLIDGQKMSKSLDNFYTLSDLEERGFDPLSLRYLFLTAHYRDKLNFTWQSLEASQNALNNLREIMRGWDEPNIGCAAIEQDFEESINNDLNMPQALAVMWDMVKSDNPTSAKSQTLLKMDQVFGLNLEEYISKKIKIPENVQRLAEEREEARKSGNFEAADQIRKKIKASGYEIDDTPEGPRIKKVS